MITTEFFGFQKLVVVYDTLIVFAIMLIVLGITTLDARKVSGEKGKKKVTNKLLVVVLLIFVTVYCYFAIMSPLNAFPLIDNQILLINIFIFVVLSTFRGIYGWSANEYPIIVPFLFILSASGAGLLLNIIFIDFSLVLTFVLSTFGASFYIIGSIESP